MQKEINKTNTIRAKTKEETKNSSTLIGLMVLAGLGASMFLASASEEQPDIPLSESFISLQVLLQDLLDECSKVKCNSTVSNVDNILEFIEVYNDLLVELAYIEDTFEGEIYDEVLSEIEVDKYLELQNKLEESLIELKELFFKSLKVRDPAYPSKYTFEYDEYCYIHDFESINPNPIVLNNESGPTAGTKDGYRYFLDGNEYEFSEWLESSELGMNFDLSFKDFIDSKRIKELRIENTMNIIDPDTKMRIATARIYNNFLEVVLFSSKGTSVRTIKRPIFDLDHDLEWPFARVELNQSCMRKPVLDEIGSEKLQKVEDICNLFFYHYTHPAHSSEKPSATNELKKENEKYFDTFSSVITYNIDKTTVLSYTLENDFGKSLSYKLTTL